MFTGIVGHRGRVADLVEIRAGRRLLVDAVGWPHRPQAGESIAVNGCCLTVVESRPMLAFDVIPQTLSRTNLGDLAAGDAVNLEPSLTPASLMSGHFVQGHIDGVGVITSVTDDADGRRLEIRPPADLMDSIVPRGSIAVDGVSLTLAEVGEETFTIALIPTTLELTNLDRAAPGRRVNLETDMIVKTIVHYLRRVRG